MLIYVSFYSWQQFMNSYFKYSYFFLKLALIILNLTLLFKLVHHLFTRGKVLAVVVTVQVKLLVPEFMVTHLLPYLLTIPLCGQ